MDTKLYMASFKEAQVFQRDKERRSVMTDQMDLLPLVAVDDSPDPDDKGKGGH